MGDWDTKNQPMLTSENVNIDWVRPTPESILCHFVFFGMFGEASVKNAIFPQ